MSPLAALLLFGSFALSYVVLSADIVGAHTEKDLLPRRWLGLSERPYARRKGWLVIEVLVLVVVVSLTQWAMATVAADETKESYLRLMAGVELCVASAWTVYAIVAMARSH